ncbi:hypothetical protein ACFP81_02715 [Deinococcus lacus]|uniref:Uncharacterized protein n=1 Tax=Deinococcus lacus TaxID=392561 RepID=A0ABW1YAN0_9DEIO
MTLPEKPTPDAARSAAPEPSETQSGTRRRKTAPEAATPAPTGRSETRVVRIQDLPMPGVGTPVTVTGPAPSVPAGSATPVPAKVIPKLHALFPTAQTHLGHFLPAVAATQLGLQVDFCDLHIFLTHLHVQGWNGFLHVQLRREHAYALLVDGRPVAAASEGAADLPPLAGERALAELMRLYQEGGNASAHPLLPEYALVLSSLQGGPPASSG